VVLNATEPESGPSKEAKKNKEAKKKGVVVADPVGAQTANQVTPLAVGPSTAPSTAGKFFYYSPFDGKDHSCSGSTINSAYKNLVMTAGHCVHGGQGSGYYTDFAYSPGYFNGPNLSYGVWTWESARTLTAWANNSDTSRDQAFVAFAPRGAQELVNVVGANGLVIGNSTAQSNTRIFGWPAEAPYDGERPYYCDGDTSAYAFSSTDAALYCDMTGGASGGPWLKDRINQDTGYVFAVTSRRTLIGRPLLLATPNTSAVQSMYNLMT
jgi:V8-like Glu-specific endopeptidase